MVRWWRGLAGALKALIIIALTILATSTAAGGMAAAVPASAAPASSLPKIQTGIRPPSSWHRTWRVRPDYVYFGQGAGYAAPRIGSLHWSHYGQTGSYATGYWWNDNCRPTCVQGGHWTSARVHFYDVFFHAGPWAQLRQGQRGLAGRPLGRPRR